MKWVRPFRFLLALMAVIGLAYLAPAAPLRAPRAARAVQSGCMAGIFLLSGLTLPTRVLRASAGHWRLHLFVQVFNLGLIPALFAVLRPLLPRLGVQPALADGFVILGCVPTTIASSVALTVLARGNEAGAIFNSTLGNLLGVVVSPLLIYLLLSLRGSLDWVVVARELALLVILPMLVGQVGRLPFGRFAAAHRRRLNAMSLVLLLGMIYFVFAATFARGVALSGGSLAVAIGVVLLIHPLLLALNWRLSKAPIWRMDRGDRIAGLMCGTQKTAAMGIPLIAILYAHGPLVGLISVPLLCYHPVQLLVGTFLGVLLGKGGGD